LLISALTISIKVGQKLDVILTIGMPFHNGFGGRELRRRCGFTGSAFLPPAAA
jgi:hypothetical protein